MSTSHDPLCHRHVAATPPPRRSLRQLCQINAVQFGLEFIFATESALVTPILLQLGLPDHLFGIAWLLPPILGLVLSPCVGSSSDRCRGGWGRRRPFLLALGIGVIMGVVLYLNGGEMGVLMSENTHDKLLSLIITMSGVVLVDFCADTSDIPARAYLVDVCDMEDIGKGLNIRLILGGIGGGLGYIFNAIDWMSTPIGTALGSQLRAICLFNVLFYTTGVALTMCSIPEVPYRGPVSSSSSSSSSSLSCCCCCNEESGEFRVERVRSSYDGRIEVDDDVDDMYDNGDDGDEISDYERQPLLGSGWSESIQFETEHDRTEYSRQRRPAYGSTKNRRTIRDRAQNGNETKRTSNITDGSSDRDPCHIHFFPSPDGRTSSTDATSSSGHAVIDVVHDEVDNTLLKMASSVSEDSGTAQNSSLNTNNNVSISGHNSGNPDAIKNGHDNGGAGSSQSRDSEGRRDRLDVGEEEPMSVVNLWKSSIFMPCVLRRLLFTHNVSWTAFMTMLLFFTDYMGHVVYQGDPGAPANSPALLRYDEGVKMGCWGMCIYSFSAAISGLALTRLDHLLSLRTIYVFGQLVFAVGCGIMIVFVAKPYATISLCATFGVHYAVMAKVPTSIVAKYHESTSYTRPAGGLARGLATDFACLQAQVFFAQITVSTLLGLLVRATGTRLTVVVFASALAFLASLMSACFIDYDIR